MCNYYKLHQKHSMQIVLFATMLLIATFISVSLAATDCEKMFNQMARHFQMAMGPDTTRVLDSTAGKLTAYRGMVRLKTGRQLFADFRPAKNGKPTIVMLNGLTVDHRNWQGVVKQLDQLDSDYGILRYDPFGMGETLRYYGPNDQEITMGQQASDLRLLLDRLGIEEQVYLVGLSYGGGLALQFASQYPQKIKQIVLLAPFTAPLETQEKIINSAIGVQKFFLALNPWIKKSYDELHDFNTKMLIYFQYPLAEPDILSDVHKPNAVFNMVRGLYRTYHIADIIPNLPPNSVHLVIAKQDQYLPTSTLINFWQQLSPEQQGSLLFLDGSEHKITQAAPDFTGSWLNLIMKQDQRIIAGETYQGVNHAKTVEGPEGVFKIE